MGKIMILKKFKTLSALTLLLVFDAHAIASNEPSSKASAQLPILHYAGVIPVQWDKDELWQDLSHIKKSINSEFSDAVRSSKRFVMVNDELVASLWKTPAGRRDLETDYEISAFANLDVTSRGDMVVLTSRILSPKLETRLQESEVVPRKWLAESSRDQTSARLVDLVQRMINRLPIDVHVTSVNGNYLTLSGGTEQGIKAGNTFDVLSATVESLHPANGSWISFGTMKTGSADIIEVKTHSSIAKISALTYDNSIKPGDGIVVPDISGRGRFARAEESSTLASATGESQAIIDPIKTNGSTPKDTTSPAPMPPTAAKQAEAVAIPAVPEEKPAAPETSLAKGSEKPETKQEPKPETPPEIPAEPDNFTAKLMPKGSEMRTWLGMKMWSISGSASATSALPAWIVNSAGADIYRKYSDTIDFNYGLDLGYGPTAKGNFFGYNLHSAGRWHMYLKDILPGADDVYFGLQASMASTSISGDTSGGYDMTMVSLTIGVHGWARPDFIGDKIEWTGEIFYPLYYSGRFGIKGGYKAIESGSSMAFRIGGYLGERPAVGWQYGAAFDYESSSWSLEKSKTAAIGSIGILALARRNI